MYCNICGKEYHNATRPHYCSDTCSIEANLLKQRARKNYRTTKNGQKYNAYLKLRFETFKRDNFTCQYCGRHAPQVKIVADHIIPVSKGGETSMNNLITACEECNLGKSNNILSIRLNNSTPQG